MKKVRPAVKFLQQWAVGEASFGEKAPDAPNKMLTFILLCDWSRVESTRCRTGATSLIPPSQVEPLSPSVLDQKPCQNAVRSLQSVIQVQGESCASRCLLFLNFPPLTHAFRDKGVVAIRHQRILVARNSQASIALTVCEIL